MKKTFLLTMMLAFCSILSVSADNYTYPITSGELAFPGAEGFGKYTQGGRGGEVYYVTRNDDCTDDNLVQGTLRWALKHDNGGKPRTVLFATSGVIFLTSKLTLSYPDVSILGQSAPGGGICIAGYKLYICKNNVIVRYVRFRAGDAIDTNQTSLDIENAKNVIIDHCSMTWSMEECMTAYDTDYTTVQYCIIGEGLYNSFHDKGARAYAMQWGGEHSTLHHCLVTNSVNRTPLFNGVRSNSNNRGDHDYQVDSEFANNVLFNFGKSNSSHGGACYYPNGVVKELEGYGAPYDNLASVNNYFIPGPASAKGCATARQFVYADSQGGSYWLSGNKYAVPSDFSITTGVWASDVIAAVNVNNFYGTDTTPFSSDAAFNHEDSQYTILTEQPESTKSGMTYETADKAYATTIAKAGARLPRFDEVDTRLIAEAAGTQKPQFSASYAAAGIIDSPSDVVLQDAMAYSVGGIVHQDYPNILAQSTDKYIVDSDYDGIPDSYNGTLEAYMNGLADGSVTKSDYETADYFTVQDAPATVAISFSKADTEKGTLPEGASVDYGKTYTIPEGTITKPSDESYDYTFFGWAANGQVYKAGDTFYPIADMAFTPTFTRKKAEAKHPDHTTHSGTIVAEYILNGNDVAAPDNLTYGDIFTVSDLTPERGSNLTYEGLGAINKINFTKFGNNSASTVKSSKDATNAITLKLTPASTNITYKLDSITFYCIGAGTGDVRLQMGNKVGDNAESNLSVVYGTNAASTGAITIINSSAAGSTEAETKGKTKVKATPTTEETLSASARTLYFYLYNFKGGKAASVYDIKVYCSWEDSSIPTAISEVNATKQLQPLKHKYLKDGHLLITNGTHTYNAAGQLVK